MTHFALVPTGSSGDVNPYLGIGVALLGRGHDVTIVTAEPFRAAVQAIGARFEPHQSTEAFNRIIDNPRVWHPLHGPRVLLGSVADGMDIGLAALERACRPETVIVGHSISFHARVYEELHGNKAVTLHLAPSAYRSLEVMPAFVPGRDLASAPVWVKRALWRVADAVLLDRHILPRFNPWRARRGLPPINGIFKTWLHSPQGTIGLFPDWFGPPRRDWPARTVLTGFVRYDGPHTGLPADLHDFVEQGDPPIVFAHGSVNRHARGFFSAAIEATRRLGRRAVLQTRYRDQLPIDLPAHVRHVDYAPFAELLPTGSAIVHHGGVGTCARGLAAGLPQLVVPMAFDQADNATQLLRLGVAEWIHPRRVTPHRLAQTLDRLIADPARSERCATWRDRVRRDHPTDRTLAHLESL